MKTKQNAPITKAALRIMKSLVRILMRNGVAYGTLAELLRKTYVDVAFEQMEKSGTRATVSGVSAMTGLTRKETKRLHELDVLDTEATDQKYNRAVRVISGWLNDHRFQTPEGQAAILPIEGQGSFSELVKSYSGDIPVAAMLSLLKEARCISEGEQGIALISHAYIPQSDPEEKLNILGIDTSELIETIDFNLSAPADQRRFQRKVSNHLLAHNQREAFKRLSAEKSQALLEELDSWLTEHEENDPGAASYYVALGIYYTDKLNEPKDNDYE